MSEADELVAFVTRTLHTDDIADTLKALQAARVRSLNTLRALSDGQCCMCLVYVHNSCVEHSFASREPQGAQTI